MRLTHVKLAGFKSFVDPTTIPIPGNLVGIVGPNGCGKSNVIDAVRWVLGESSARHLRGETMQDVIFNGSGERKPVARASVELTFDNSLGKAAGQWSHYAEISVKRVLSRNGDSSYYINNLHVRRRDVTDIFLGTGLGPRAYAIIEQGMISRIVESRPDELRIFLEEAAGVSRYKDRRRETELRLRDARENLVRVADIREELAQQLLRLESQAEVAQHYQQLQQQLRTTHNLLLLLKKREAAAQRERARQDAQRLLNEIEAQTARLRQAESRLEQARADHFAASDALHASQGELYAANAEVARLEQQLQHVRENRQRLASQLASLQERQGGLEQQRQVAGQDLAQWRQKLGGAQQRTGQLHQQLEQARGELPLAEEKFRDGQRRYSELQRELAEAERARQIEETHCTHAERNLQQLELRQERLLREKQALPLAGTEDLLRGQEGLTAASAALAAAQAEHERAQAGLHGAEESWRGAQQRQHEVQQQATRLEARLNALQQLQEKLERNEKLRDWLACHGLEKLPRLWHDIEIEAGWESALEGVLGSRLNAVTLRDLEPVRDWASDPPPAPLILCAPGQGGRQGGGAPDLTPLRSHVTNKPGAAQSLAGVLDDWLHQVYAAADLGQALQLRARLAPGMSVVCREGHVVTSHSIAFHAPQSELHGVLARQREIGQLQAELEARLAELADLQAKAAQCEAALRQVQAALPKLRAAAADAQHHHHRLQMEVQKLVQQQQHVEQRSRQIGEELQEIEAQIVDEREMLEAGRARLKVQRAQIEALGEQVQDLKQERFQAENAMNRARQSLQAAEREAQEAIFNEKNCANKISELENLINVLGEQAAGLTEQRAGLENELAALEEAPLREALQQALVVRQKNEGVLGQARAKLDEAAFALGEIEQLRLQSDQALHPLRNREGEVRLKEQEARLNEEQCGEQLRAAGADEAELGRLLEKNARPAALQGEIARLNEEIQALGGVNLAALEELQSGRQRKAYLDAQADDLGQAVETLEEAIRRIDRETRERLQETFDEVNRHFGELFPAIFGGGQARLELTGDEILDAGLQFMAQPPGKRNSSIHLLSGGEKALTAMALVFALFRLNPAPFCLLDEVDAPLDDTNTERFCELVKKMACSTQFIFISHNKITMEMAQQLIGVTMQESGVSRVVAVDVEEALRMHEQAVA